MEDSCVPLPELDGFQPPPEKKRPGQSRGDSPRFILVNGPKPSGKTTLVETVIATLAGRELRIAGILAQGLWRDGLRAGFDLINLASVHPEMRIFVQDQGMRKK